MCCTAYSCFAQKLEIVARKKRFAVSGCLTIWGAVDENNYPVIG